MFIQKLTTNVKGKKSDLFIIYSSNGAIKKILDDENKYSGFYELPSLNITVQQFNELKKKGN